MKQSDRVRELVRTKYVKPALLAGKSRFSVAVKDLIPDLVAQGFPPGNTPQVCTAPRKESFLREEGIEIESIDGPPSKMSTSVVFHFKVSNPNQLSGTNWNSLSGTSMLVTDAMSNRDDPAARAQRLTDNLRGLLKEELAEYGGGEAFVRWVRGHDEEERE